MLTPFQNVKYLFTQGGSGLSPGLAFFNPRLSIVWKALQRSLGHVSLAMMSGLNMDWTLASWSSFDQS